MPDIKILGPGCANCYRLEGLAVAVLELMAEASPARYDLERVTLMHLHEPEDFRGYGLLCTPGLVINGKLVCGGRVPSALEIREWLAEAVERDEGAVTDEP